MGECAYAKSKRKTVGQYYAEAREYYDKGKDKSAAKTLKKAHFPLPQISTSPYASWANLL